VGESFKRERAVATLKLPGEWLAEEAIGQIKIHYQPCLFIAFLGE
jgi:hypothetical protein